MPDGSSSEPNIKTYSKSGDVQDGEESRAFRTCNLEFGQGEPLTKQ